MKRMTAGQFLVLGGSNSKISSVVILDVKHPFDTISRWKTSRGLKDSLMAR